MRLSNIERGYVQATRQELQRPTSAPEQSIDARAAIQKTAAGVAGPPGEAG
jgi:hypothetical protein